LVIKKTEGEGWGAPGGDGAALRADQGVFAGGAREGPIDGGDEGEEGVELEAGVVVEGDEGVAL
jgi:hypothetical protein